MLFVRHGQTPTTGTTLPGRAKGLRLADKGREEIRVLVSTDVLSEGLNLQDASRMINYDIHWNPVRLMQRIGRVDRPREAEDLELGIEIARDARGHDLRERF